MDDLGRVLAYIEHNVEGDVDGPMLSEVAALSRFHLTHEAFGRAFYLPAGEDS